MKKIILSIAILVALDNSTIAQSVGIGTTAPDASAVLELKATNKGFLPPRVTAAQKGLIPTPKTGLMIYQTDGATGLYLYNGTTWTAVAGAPGGTGTGWALNGNAGTNPAANFIGTTDNQSLKFRVNNTTAGEINTVNANTALGQYTLSANNTGYQNTALGFNSLNKNTEGNDNTSVGLGSLFNNTTGSSNAAFGNSALVSNATGNNNTAAGNNSMYKNVSGNSNVAIGTDAAYSNTTGSYSIAVGDSALYHNTSSYNVGIGSKSLYTNTSGVSNTAIGSLSMYNNLTGSQNTALGRIAMYANTTGIQNTAVGMQAMRYSESGNANTAIGFQSLFFNTLNSNNTAIGQGSLANTTSDNNTAIGQASLSANTFGYGNTAVGKDALVNNVAGNYNTAIGYQAAVYGNNYVNATAVGANAQSACSDCVVLGSVNGYNGATANAKVGIGITNPQKTLHVNPNGAGGIFIGDNFNSGGYTGLNMGISQAQGGYSYLQGIRSSGSTYGTIIINPNGGFVGIRTTTANAALHIKMYDDAYPITDAGLRIERAQNTNHWDMGVDFVNDISYSYNGVTKFYLDNIDGTLHSVSDMRMKKDITTIGAVLPSIMKLEAKTYHYLDNPANAALSYGFLAQDVEKIFPDFVKTKGPDGMKAIGYQKLNVIAIKAIQEQQQQIETLKTENTTIKAQLVKMQEAIEALQKK